MDRLGPMVPVWSIFTLAVFIGDVKAVLTLIRAMARPGIATSAASARSDVSSPH